MIDVMGFTGEICPDRLGIKSTHYLVSSPAGGWICNFCGQRPSDDDD